jgi:serine/threonine protein kinase
MKLLGHDFGKESVAINGRKYKVKQELGRGGFAIIVLVKDTKTKQKFALKRSICREEFAMKKRKKKKIEFYFFLIFSLQNRNKRTFAHCTKGARRLPGIFRLSRRSATSRRNGMRFKYNSRCTRNITCAPTRRHLAASRH